MTFAHKPIKIKLFDAGAIGDEVQWRVNVGASVNTAIKPRNVTWRTSVHVGDTLQHDRRIAFPHGQSGRNWQGDVYDVEHGIESLG